MSSWSKQSLLIQSQNQTILCTLKQVKLSFAHTHKNIFNCEAIKTIFLRDQLLALISKDNIANGK